MNSYVTVVTHDVNFVFHGNQTLETLHKGMLVWGELQAIDYHIHVECYFP